MDPGMDMTMLMYFYNSSKVHLIFGGWDPQSNKAYFGCLVAAFLFGFMAETLCILKDFIDRWTTERLRARRVSGRIMQAIFTFF